MREVEAGDARGGPHRIALGELDPHRGRVEQREQRALAGVVGAGGIAERGADAAVALGDQVFVRELLVGAVAPLAARARVQVLGERLGEPVGERLHHDRVVVVEVLLERAREVVGLDARGDRKRTDVVGDAGFERRDEIGEAEVRLAVGLLSLLAQHREAHQLARARRVAEQHEVVAIAAPRARSRTPRAA